jgi:hypothetical protein
MTMKKTHKIDLRVNSEELTAIQDRSSQLGITQTELLINSVLKPKLLEKAIDRQFYSQIALLTTELNRINLHLQKITKAIRQNSEPTVVVERELLLNNQKLVQDAIALTKNLMHQLVH